MGCFKNRFEFYIGNSKIIYLAKSIQVYILNEEKSCNAKGQNIDEQLKLFHSNYRFNYVSKEYPLVHSDAYDNVLGPLFRKSNVKPNVVLLIVESLSSSFCGERANLANLTPFIDSLIKKSLYWPNFISNAERSYGALPNILASLPYGGYRGFTSLFEQNRFFPDHNSLIQILKENNYYTSFFYGGWAYYENMGNFLDYSGVDQMFYENNFDKNKFDKTNGGNDEFYWGYNDMDLIVNVLEKQKSRQFNNPFLNIVNTLSMHTPFNLSRKEYYDVGFLKKRLSKLNYNFSDINSKFSQVPASQIEAFGYSDKFVNQLTKNMLASVFFTDDALNYFFTQYQKCPEFNNTIFIITGDHNIGTLPLLNELDNYRVPLIIYSPLLKGNKVFPAVSSHIDILPSLLALLNGNFNVRIPKIQHWLGFGLDTVQYYRNRSTYALSLYSDNFPNMFVKDYLVCNNRVFRVTENMENLLPCNPQTRDSLLYILNNFRRINTFVCKGNKIWNPGFLHM